MRLTAPADTITYATMNLAVYRTSHTLFPISTRNSAAAVAHLLQAAAVDHVLLGREPAMRELYAAAVDLLKSAGGAPPSHSTMPIFEDLYAGTESADALLPPMAAYDFKETCLILHSSGAPRPSAPRRR